MSRKTSSNPSACAESLKATRRGHVPWDLRLRDLLEAARPQTGGLPLTLRSPRTLLRAPRYVDVPALVEALGEREVVRWLGHVPYPYRAHHARAHVAGARQAMREGAALHLQIITSNPAPARTSPATAFDRPAQCCGALSLEGPPSHLSFGYWLAPSFWGYGFMREAAQTLLTYAFAQPGVEIVEAGYFAANTRSSRLQTALGFTPIRREQRAQPLRGAMAPFIVTTLNASAFTKATEAFKTSPHNGAQTPSPKPALHGEHAHPAAISARHRLKP
ncbi:MAG: GNAT family N-acetyltransferase [Pseudomonadota bacterium]